MGTYDMPIHASNNRREMAFATTAGCFRCVTLFDPKTIKEYTDAGNTCVCPNCGKPTVVTDQTGKPLTEERLLRAKNYWFPNTTDPNSQPSGPTP